MPMHQRRPAPRPAIRHRLHHRPVARNRVRPIHLNKMKVRIIRHQPRDVSPRSVHLHRRRDRVLVVLDHIHHRQPLIARRVQRLPEFALAGRSLAQRHIRHLVALERHILELSIVPRVFLRRLGMPRKESPSLRASNRVHALCRRRRARRHNVQLPARPVRRHLPPAARRVVRRAHRL